MSKAEDDEIPPFLDRRLNGRCRAYWFAASKCPPSRNGHEFAMGTYHKYIERSRKVDEREGLPKCMKLSPGHRVRSRAPTQPAVRQRQPVVRTRQPVKAVRQRTIPT